MCARARYVLYTRGHLLGDGGEGGHDKRPELLPRALLLYLVSDRVEDPGVDALAALLGGVADLVAGEAVAAVAPNPDRYRLIGLRIVSIARGRCPPVALGPVTHRGTSFGHLPVSYHIARDYASICPADYASIVIMSKNQSADLSVPLKLRLPA